MKNVISVVAMIVLLVGTSRCTPLVKPSADGTCQCAVFKGNEAHGEDVVPVIQKTPAFTVTCDDEGHAQCLRMCTALAQAAKESAPIMLCEAVQDLKEGFQPSVFSKACDSQTWNYTGMTAKVPICCADGKQTSCAAQVE